MLDHRLKHVVAVAHKGSFTGAAELVGVTQSAVTKSVADLERELGYPIFLRTSRGAMPTEDGQDFLERASRLMEDAQDLVGRSRRKEENATEILRIGVYPASLEWRLLEPLTALRSRHPGIRFKIEGAQHDRLAQQLRNRRVDVAFGFERLFADPEQFKHYPVEELKPYMVVRRGHPLLAKSSVTVEDLAQYELICPSTSAPYASLIRDIYEANGISSNQFVHVIDYCPIMRRIVLTSDAVGVTNVGVQPFSIDDDLAVLGNLALWEPQPLCLAIRVGWKPGSGARAFINQVCYPDVTFPVN